MFGSKRAKNIEVGFTFFDPNTHFILVRYNLEKKGFINGSMYNQDQLVTPLGYTIVSSDTESILYVNTVKIKTKVYKNVENNRRFCPEFGTPVKTK